MADGSRTRTILSPGAPLPGATHAGPALVRLPPATVGRLVGIGATVAVAYIAAAELGFRVAFVAEQVTTVWAPTGIALATLLLWGVRLWPAIWVGAFVANAGADAPLWTASVIATGNTLEAVAATWALRRLLHFDAALQRVSDVLAFVGIGAGLCTTVSATTGAATLCAAGVQPWARFAPIWFDWWLGDALGAVVVAPAILTLAARPWRSRAEWIRASAFVGGTAIVTHLVFGQDLEFSAHPLLYVVFPVVIAAAVSGGPPLTALVVLTASAVTIWNTVRGAGPFASPEVHQSLILLQTFMGVLAGTAMLLGAAIAERETSERRARDAAEGLRRREEMLRLAQRAGGVATFDWDLRRQTAHCSAEFFRIFGLPERDGPITSAEWAQFVHPADADRMADHLARVVEGVEPAAADYRIVLADGTTRWLSYAGQLQTTRDGPRLVGTVLDVTNRKRLEGELRHHAAEVERLLESLGEGFISLDREFRSVYVNRAAEQMLGRSRTELLGRLAWEVFPPEIVQESRRHLESALATGAVGRFDVHVPAWKRWFENRVYPSPAGVSIFVADVTARMEADAALRESRDVLSLAMRGGSMGAWSRNLVTNEVWWSRELEEIVGLPPGAFSRTEAGFFEVVHPDNRDAVRRAVDSAVESRSDYVVEFRFRHGNGEWRWMEGRGRAVYGSDGAPRHLYGLGIDVTARKETEMALQEAKNQAESANRLKDQFLATLSHELRTPLNVILGYAQMLQTDAIDPDRRQRAIEVIERNAAAQHRLVEDLLDMSRITTGKVRLDSRPIAIAAVLREAVEAIKPAAEAKRIVLDLNLDPRAGAVIADPTRLQQVFWNLLTNAVKFTGPGGRVVAAARRDGEDVEVSVSDTGVGIPLDFLPFVFQPFWQAEAPPGRTHGGLGLGLAICRQLVELHGGTIRASSRGTGEGATFVVRLPAWQQTGAESTGRPAPGMEAGAADEARAGDSSPSPQALEVRPVDAREET